ncbi:MAG: glutamate--cysteine ligase [Alphaproteobacteria bacterium]|nr:glutamate--cysteine ligase [Alphaproteobacteria bacterium]
MPEAAASSEPVTAKDQLVDYLAAGCKPREDWRIGTEHEKFAFSLDGLKPLPYEGPSSIRAMLEGLTRFGWKPVMEDGRPIALRKGGHGSITLEPGGQFELSGEPLETLHETCREVHEHLAQVKEVAAEIGAGFLGIGFIPKWRREDMPWMPKGRYGIMRAYMPTRGDHGIDMMIRTCTIQVNLDFESEADMVEKFRIGLALQPVVTALFANSPFVEGKPSGYLSYRSFVWTDTDPDRCGTLPFVFEGGFGFERYVDYMLDVPMYFVYRDGRYIDASGQSFRDFLAGRLPALPGELPTMGDWEDHLTTVFPEVRLKRFLEMRGADGGPWRRICALPAFWVGLLYDAQAQAEAARLVADWTTAEHDYLRAEVPKHALKTEFRGRTMLELAREVVAIARGGLQRRARPDGSVADEVHHLDTLEDILERGSTPAEVKLASFEGRWKGEVDPIYKEYAY